MRRAVVVALLTLALGACGSGRAGFVAEDDPGWDCATMGNMRCN